MQEQVNNSTRHKSRNGETHNEAKEEKQNDNFGNKTKNCSYTMCGRVGCEHCYPNEDFRKTNDTFERVGWQMKRGKEIKYSKKTEKEEDLLFQKDNETHKGNNLTYYKFLVVGLKKPIKYNNSEYYPSNKYFSITEDDSWNMVRFVMDNPHVTLVEVKLLKEEVTEELEFKSVCKYSIIGIGDVIVVKSKSKEYPIGKEVLIDGEKYKVIGVDTQGYFKVGEEVGLIVSKIAEKETKYEWMQMNSDKKSEINSNGIKETNGKIDYSEINLEILDLMAERFTANKHKYPQGNMKKPIDIKSLEWALFRHIKKMIKPIENDTETYKEHLSAILCNASMILDQLHLKEQK